MDGHIFEKFDNVALVVIPKVSSFHEFIRNNCEFKGVDKTHKMRD